MSASVSRDLYNAAKNYICGIFQQGKPPMDADINDSRMCLYHHIKSLGDYMGVHGFSGTGFSVVAYPPQPRNNLALNAGYGYCNGMRLYLAETSSICLDADSASSRGICSVLDSVVGSTFTDNRMNWATNEHANKTVRFLTPDGDSFSATVSSNTSTTFTTTTPPSALILPGCSYSFSAPTYAGPPNHYQLVCLNCFQDQAGSAEDPVLLHALAGGTEVEQRWKVRQVVEIVASTGATYSSGDLPSDYTDILGNEHTYVPLAVVRRSSFDIVASDITAGADARPHFYEINEYVLKAGDTMTGDLNMGDNLVTGGLAEIDFEKGYSEGIRHTLTDTDGSGSERVYFEAEHRGGDVLPVPYAIKFNTSIDGKLARVQASYPMFINDLTTREYVDEQIVSHGHSQYIQTASLGLTALEDVQALCLAQLGTSTFAVGDTIIWNHGLACSFLVVQLQIKPVSGPSMDRWINGEAEFDWVQKDDNYITITNNGVASLDGTRLRIVAWRAILDPVLVLAETMTTATFAESPASLSFS